MDRRVRVGETIPFSGSDPPAGDPMRIIDDKGRLFGLINIIDLVVLLLIVVVLGRFGASRFLQRSGGPGVEQSELEVVVIVENVRQATVDVIKPGDRVIETKTNSPVGTVTQLEVQPSTVFKQLDDGTFIESQSASRFDVWVTIKGAGRVTPNVVMLGNNEVRVGTQLSLRTNIWAVKATVMQIKVLSGPTPSS